MDILRVVDDITCNVKLTLLCVNLNVSSISANLLHSQLFDFFIFDNFDLLIVFSECIHWMVWFYHLLVEFITKYLLEKDIN